VANNANDREWENPFQFAGIPVIRGQNQSTLLRVISVFRG
jgi:hypothetical protein